MSPVVQLYASIRLKQVFNFYLFQTYKQVRKFQFYCAEVCSKTNRFCLSARIKLNRILSMHLLIQTQVLTGFLYLHRLLKLVVSEFVGLGGIFCVIPLLLQWVWASLTFLSCVILFCYREYFDKIQMVMLLEMWLPRIIYFWKKYSKIVSFIYNNEWGALK